MGDVSLREILALYAFCKGKRSPGRITQFYSLKGGQKSIAYESWKKKYVLVLCGSLKCEKKMVYLFK